MKEIIKKFIPQSLLLSYHKLLAKLAAFFYGYPSRKMIIIGVTGTTGKTTVCNMICKILEEAGYKVGLATTANFKIKDKEWPNTFKQTMLGRFALQRLLALMAEAGCEYAVIETTSEGLAQYRHLGIDYDLAVFTNLTPEHIERHGSFEAYKQAKGKLFAKLKQSRYKKINHKWIKKIIIANLDSEHAEYYLGFEADEKIGYTLKNQKSKFKNQKYTDFIKGPRPNWDKQKIKEVQVENVNFSSGRVNFTIQGVPIGLKLLGKFNVYNALAAICVGLSQGIDLKVMKRALEKVQTVPGRMEIIDEGQSFLVVVDYAHEPAGLESIYQTLNDLRKPQTKIISVLGGQGGGRDKRKRPILGRLAGQHTDYVIITNEDPYDEDPQIIIDQVAEGAVAQGKILGQNLWKILDRKEAIKKALELARPNDIVIITGKGCEQYIVGANNKKIPHDDRKVVRELLRSKILDERIKE